MDTNTTIQAIMLKYLKQMDKKDNEYHAYIEKTVPLLVEKKFDELNPKDSINEMLRSLDSEFKKYLKDNSLQVIDNMEKSLLNEYKQAIDSLEKPKDGEDGKDGKDGNDYIITSDDYKNIAELVEVEIPEYEIPEQPTPDDIRDMLETLQGDDRLDISAIKGFDEMLRKLKTHNGNVTIGSRGIQDAPKDGITYGRNDGKWVEVSGGGVEQYATLGNFPATGETDILYVAQDTNLVYRWDGTAYVVVGDGSETNWGDIGGTLSNQTDLQNALNDKADTSNVLELDNTTTFTPNADYEPSTKKYVDDSIGGDIEATGIYVDRTHEFGGTANPFAKLGLHTLHGNANLLSIQKAGNSNYISIDTNSATITSRNNDVGNYIKLSSEDSSFVGNTFFNFRVIQHNAANNNDGYYLNINNTFASSGVRGIVNVNGDLVVNDYSSLSAVEKVRLGNDGSGYFEGSVGVGTSSPDTKIHNTGAYTQESIAEPSNPTPGKSVQWVSNGTGTGDAGDVMMKINVGGVVKTTTLVDYSAI